MSSVELGLFTRESTRQTQKGPFKACEIYLHDQLLPFAVVEHYADLVPDAFHIQWTTYWTGAEVLTELADKCVENKPGAELFGHIGNLEKARVHYNQLRMGGILMVPRVTIISENPPSLGVVRATAKLMVATAICGDTEFDVLNGVINEYVVRQRAFWDVGFSQQQRLNNGTSLPIANGSSVFSEPTIKDRYQRILQTIQRFGRRRSLGR